MCFKTVIYLMVIIVALCLVKTQNIYTSIQMSQQQRNDDFEQPPKSVTVFELEVNMEVRPNSMPTNFESQQTIIAGNLNRVEHEDRIVFPSQSEEQTNENRRQEFNERDRMRDNNMTESVIEFNREQERKNFRSEQGRGSTPKQEFIAKIEGRPDHNSIPKRENDREFDNYSNRVMELNRKQERESYRSEQDRSASNRQAFIVRKDMRPDRNIGLNRTTESWNAVEFNLEQETELNRSDQTKVSPARRVFNNDTERMPHRNSRPNIHDNVREFVDSPDRLKEFNRERERDQRKGATNRQESRRKSDGKPDRNSAFNGTIEEGVIPQVLEEKSPRLCETKYNEYIARIFRNDEEVTADANDSEFDGRVLASPGEYPHMTALGFEREDNTFDYKCGGSLISENFVITAAHCTNVTGEVPTIARIGDINLMVDEKRLEPQIFRIRRIHTHPQYDGVTYYNDIALLQLNTSVEFTEFVRPIKLWTRPKLPLLTAFAMGYGATSFARAPTQKLTDFNLTLIPNDECNRRLPQLDEIPRGIIASQICAEDFVMHRDTCQGDSGGPLQYNIRGKRRRNRVHYHLIGITSFGLLCRSPNPGVYTRIYSYLDWIERTVWNSL